MDDRFLHDFRRQPDREFAARLRASLHAASTGAGAGGARAIMFRKWFAAAASIAIVGFAFTLPPVQAAAQAFLDLFRVQQFTGVSFDPERLQSLESSGFDQTTIFGDVEPLTEPAEPVAYASAAEAGEAAGLRVRTPAWVPPGYVSTGFLVSSEHAARITVNTAGLQVLLDALGLDDVELPEGLDDQATTIRVPPVVNETYANDERTLHVIQAESPDATFPAGLDLDRLAYAGLRVLGMPQDEAYNMSVTIDWRSTLIVPVPSGAGAFRPVNVAGNDGLLITNVSSGERRGGSVLLWAADGRTYAVTGRLDGAELLEIAQTLQ